MAQTESTTRELQFSRSGGIKITTLAELGQFAGMVTQAGFAPKGMSPEQAAIAMQLGMELGLNPLQAIQNIAVINGRPSVYGDALVGLVQASGLLENYEEKMTRHDKEGTMAVVRVTRRGVSAPVVRCFSESMAKRARLWGKQGPWTEYPERMLMIRARTFALRDMFADVLKGLTSVEEAQDGAAASLPSVAVIPPRALPSLEKLFDQPGIESPQAPEVAEPTEATRRPRGRPRTVTASPPPPAQEPGPRPEPTQRPEGDVLAPVSEEEASGPAEATNAELWDVFSDLQRKITDPNQYRQIRQECGYITLDSPREAILKAIATAERLLGS
jgi:hypothetical protein